MPTAPTVVTTTRAQTNFSTNREKLDFAEGIALLDPNENPFTLISMKMARGTSGNIKHSWLEDQLVPETDCLNNASNVSSSATGLIVDNVTRFAIGDLVMHNQTRESMLVTSVGTNYIGVVRDYGSSEGWTARAAQIDDNDYLTKIGNAWEQGATLPTARSTVEVERYNYCQDQRTPFAMSEVAAAAAVHGEKDWPFQMRKAGIEHQRKLEYQNIWGMPYVGDKGIYASATGNTAPQTAGGIWYYMNRYADSARKVSQAEITMAEFLSFIEAGFKYGSREKVMYCAPILRSALDFWGISKLNTFSEQSLFGIDVAKWVSSHGTIFFVTHKMLEEPGSDGAFNFLLDMQNIKWVTYSDIGSTRLRNLDPYAATGETSKKAEYETISCIEFKLPDTHAVLYGVTSYAA